MVIVLRNVDDVLAWAGRLVDPALRAAVARLPEPSRQIADLQLGWADGPRSCAAHERSALTLVCAGAVGGDPHDAVPAAVAVELLHHWTEIRRDLHTGDLTRKHRPTAWSVFGARPATLGAEALLALAFDVAATGDPTRPAVPPTGCATPGPVRPVSGAVRQATRERTGPITGSTTVRILGDTVQQLLHGDHTTLVLGDRATGDRGNLLRECLSAAERHAGALLGSACALGALAGGGDRAQVEQLRLFGVRLGLAVQFTDDLLGIWGDPAQTGRPPYADLRRRRRSLPVTAALAAGADELAELLGREGRLGDTDLERAAKSIEQSGARAWCRQQADDLLAQALLALDLAIPSPAAVAELVALARRATRHAA
ncbi:family 2 encapsulin nanocompartment cargo protein polyprenyl transferase [Dactylosporangium fulvum]|uniref:Polyprenyl synthetase family protein n=1 Tax=Dactylosporangium fulvum TaxID=53359 RepID=A0ABY5VWA5_9ACTN|nr:polyprenyl synthetase family protein [Dactylosporangium fulvum]UWP81396.1 polyprenyl synthetase family protein [Dactylosporangium fulvum]